MALAACFPRADSCGSEGNDGRQADRGSCGSRQTNGCIRMCGSLLRCDAAIAVTEYAIVLAVLAIPVLLSMRYFAHSANGTYGRTTTDLWIRQVNIP